MNTIDSNTVESIHVLENLLVNQTQSPHVKTDHLRIQEEILTPEDFISTLDGINLGNGYGLLSRTDALNCLFLKSISGDWGIQVKTLNDHVHIEDQIIFRNIGEGSRIFGMRRNNQYRMKTLAEGCPGYNAVVTRIDNDHIILDDRIEMKNVETIHSKNIHLFVERDENDFSFQSLVSGENIDTRKNDSSIFIDYIGELPSFVFHSRENQIYIPDSEISKSCIIFSGKEHEINESTNASIGTGTKHRIHNCSDIFIASGTGHNCENTNFTSILSGSTHVASGNSVCIFSGSKNTHTGILGSILCGENHTQSAKYSSIAGGSYHCIDTKTENHLIGTGEKSIIVSRGNKIGQNHSILCGSGHEIMFAKGKNSIIFTGSLHKICDKKYNIDNSAIVTGKHHSCNAQESIIFSGESHLISNAKYSSVGTGVGHVIKADSSWISNGHDNFCHTANCWCGGTSAVSHHNDCFVWSSFPEGILTSVPNSFVIGAKEICFNPHISFSPENTAWNMCMDQDSMNVQSINCEELLEKIVQMNLNLDVDMKYSEMDLHASVLASIKALGNHFKNLKEILL